jgi:hypothetical protein
VLISSNEVDGKHLGGVSQLVGILVGVEDGLVVTTIAADGEELGGPFVGLIIHVSVH